VEQKIKNECFVFQKHPLKKVKKRNLIIFLVFLSPERERYSKINQRGWLAKAHSTTYSLPDKVRYK